MPFIFFAYQERFCKIRIDKMGYHYKRTDSKDITTQKAP